MYGQENNRKTIDIILSRISTGHKSIPNHIRDVSHPMYDGQALCKVNSHISRFRTQGLPEILKIESSNPAAFVLRQKCCFRGKKGIDSMAFGNILCSNSTAASRSHRKVSGWKHLPMRNSHFH